MSKPSYPEEFKIQAVNQVTEKKLPVADVAARPGDCATTGSDIENPVCRASCSTRLR